MKIFKTRWLARFVRREGITDKSLREAIKRAEPASLTRTSAAASSNNASTARGKGDREGTA